MKKLIQEFKEFAIQGNALDLAVGLIIGTAFGNVVRSLVNDILLPPFGLLLGKVDFSNLYISLSGQEFPSLAAAMEAGAPTLNYGLFLNTVINFIVVAFAVFLLVRLINRLKRQLIPVAVVPDTKECPYCCSKIAVKATRCPFCTSQL